MKRNQVQAQVAAEEAKRLSARIPRGAFWGVGADGRQQIVAYGSMMMFGLEDLDTLRKSLQRGLDALNVSIVDFAIFPAEHMQEIRVAVVSWLSCS